jgi:hypothetical protein
LASGFGSDLGSGLGAACAETAKAMQAVAANRGPIRVRCSLNARSSSSLTASLSGPNRAQRHCPENREGSPNRRLGRIPVCPTAPIGTGKRREWGAIPPHYRLPLMARISNIHFQPWG